jgi:hypothetical protein
MQTILEPTAGAFIVSESSTAREEGTLAAGQKLAAGSVLGRQSTAQHYTALDPLGEDGENVAVAILFAPTDATAAPTRCTVISGDCVVSPNGLTFPADLTTQHKAFALVQLRRLGIKAADEY